jgi:hypothetical protein
MSIAWFAGLTCAFQRPRRNSVCAALLLRLCCKEIAKEFLPLCLLA